MRVLLKRPLGLLLGLDLDGDRAAGGRSKSASRRQSLSFGASSAEELSSESSLRMVTRVAADDKLPPTLFLRPRQAATKRNRLVYSFNELF